MRILMGFGVMCGFRSCCWDEGVSGLTDSDKETGFLPNFWTTIKYCRKKPGFWGRATQQSTERSRMCCPNQWFVTRYFVKNPVSGAPRSHFWVDGRSGYNTENLTTKMTVMRELIQQELEKCDREQLQQVFEFIEQLSLSQESAIARTNQKTELETTFHSLVEQWKSETRGISSTEQMSVHPAYQQIIGMGRDVIPLLLRELENNSGRWFWALKSISREEPVMPEQRGKTKEMITAWLNWGREKGYKW